MPRRTPESRFHDLKRPPRNEIAVEYQRFASWLEKTTAAFTMELNFIRSLSVDEMDRLGAIEEQLRQEDGPG